MIDPESHFVAMVDDEVIAQGSRTVLNIGVEYARRHPGTTVDVYRCHNGELGNLIRSYNTANITGHFSGLISSLESDWF